MPYDGRYDHIHVVGIINFDDCCRAAKLQPKLSELIAIPALLQHTHCRQPMSLPRVVPWRDWAEWQAVYAGLYAQQPEPRMRAVARDCRTWRALREPRNVPHAVEATAALIAIEDLDAQTASLARAAAVTRAVNGALDVGQTGRDAKPLNALAEQAGLPTWLVDVRHGITHQKLPADGVLRAACDELLRFFDATYWRPQAEHLQGLRSASAKLVDDVLRAFSSSKKKRKRKINRSFWPLVLQRLSRTWWYPSWSRRSCSLLMLLLKHWSRSFLRVGRRLDLRYVPLW